MKFYSIFVLIVFACLLSLTLCEYTEEESNAWISYKNKFEKHYDDPAEDELRKQIFIENRKIIMEHNERYERGEVAYSLAINRFADWTPEEIKRLYGRYKLWFSPSLSPTEIIQQVEE
uniref:CSON012976 protein n=1 Tax=Culicoides sonorensis TaxID=179676 RepID=A0A336M6T2_CULSO